MPIILSLEDIPEVNFNSLTIDNFQAAKEATNYLIKLGHKKIAHITSPLSETRIGILRRDGYRDALKKSGIINISSKNALYNRVNLNTYFYEDVNLDFNEHSLKSYDLNMNYVSKNIKITGNVNYLNNNNFFNADIIEMDMLTKSSRIYMKKKTDKIKALVFN